MSEANYPKMTQNISDGWSMGSSPWGGHGILIIGSLDFYPTFIYCLFIQQKWGMTGMTHKMAIENCHVYNIL